MSGRGSPALAGGLPYTLTTSAWVERVGRMAGRTSGKSERKRSVRREERENEEYREGAADSRTQARGGRMTDKPEGLHLFYCLLIGGEVVAITSPRAGQGARQSLSLGATG